MNRLPLAAPEDLRDWLRQYLRADRRGVVVVLALTVAATVAGLVGPALLGEFVESVQRGTTTAHVDLLAIAFVVALVVQVLLHRASRVRAAVLGEAALARTRERFVDRVLRLPLGEVDSVDSGDMLSRATSDVEKLDEGVRHALPQIFTALVLLALTLGAMLVTSPLLTLVALITTPLLVLSTRWYRKRALPAYERLLEQWSDVRSSTHESVLGAFTVESLRLSGRRIDHGNRLLARARKTQKHTIGLQSRYFPCLDLSVFLPMAAMLLLGGWAYANDLVSLAALTAMVLYVERLADPLGDLMAWLDELQMGWAALRRILGVERIRVDREDTAGVPAEQGTGGSVVLRGVRFGYTPDRPVLHGIDLEVAAGERIAVVGSSGAGKSTLGKLLAGVHRPTAGTVHVDGVDVSDLGADELRKRIAMVTQDTHVFAGTVRDNLALPEPPAGQPDGWTDEQLLEAARAVGADEWIESCDDGLDTEVGPGETHVPEAVAQQFALVRILLAQPQVLLLDEATSALDAAASEHAEGALSAVARGRTVIAIAHRLDVARDADRIALMEGGRLVELGSHDELLEQGGLYARLWRAWTAAEAETAGAAG
ncbi:ABC transporter ATP-binding protein [Saccharothrix australiensis]|uniref:ATP-binding cassette subfamily C protein n=1 Tax=Saccharothrix australiensis TaxID=2072 RepID=A0A495W7X8_9PSEU|nr:ABC transporter ATP-binding protein [Saccharothrix australiensis]RKT57772.1 ATP-binding cassette subfamily C protein [Saccharothrix australiensis]